MVKPPPTEKLFLYAFLIGHELWSVSISPAAFILGSTQCMYSGLYLFRMVANCTPRPTGSESVASAKSAKGEIRIPNRDDRFLWPLLPLLPLQTCSDSRSILRICQFGHSLRLSETGLPNTHELHVCPPHQILQKTNRKKYPPPKKQAVSSCRYSNLTSTIHFQILQKLQTKPAGATHDRES